MRFAKRIFALIVGMIAFGNFAHAQQSVFTLPSNRLSTNASSTIAVTNTFQAVFSSNTARENCLIQNNGASNMYVFFGAIASATLNNSIMLKPSWALNCTQGGITNSDAISITGTATEVFHASQQ